VGDKWEQTVLGARLGDGSTHSEKRVFQDVFRLKNDYFMKKL